MRQFRNYTDAGKQNEDKKYVGHWGTRNLYTRTPVDILDINTHRPPMFIFYLGND